MEVIGRLRLEEFARRHPDARSPLRAWQNVVTGSRWENPADTRRTYPHADLVRLDCGLQVTVFNIAGNKYRLVTRIVYANARVYIKLVMTHAEYSHGRWKVKLCNE
jgi:mRNA interferase HigB